MVLRMGLIVTMWIVLRGEIPALGEKAEFLGLRKGSWVLRPVF